MREMEDHSSPILVLDFLFDVLQRILGDVSLQVSRQHFCGVLQVGLIVLQDREKHLKRTLILYFSPIFFSHFQRSLKPAVIHLYMPIFQTLYNKIFL